jgi:hypothetical protein
MGCTAGGGRSRYGRSEMGGGANAMPIGAGAGAASYGSYGTTYGGGYGY